MKSDKYIKILKCALISISIEFIYILITQFAIYKYMLIEPSFKTNISWGIYLYFNYILYFIFILISYLLLSFVKSKKIVFTIIGGGFVLYTLLNYSTMIIHPYRVISILFTSLVLYILGVVILRKWM